jgi:hypothetical protein
MTTKSITKAVKPAVKPAVKSVSFDAKTMATNIGQAVADNMTASATINNECKVLHLALKKAKITVGTLTSDCVIMASFVAPFKAKGLSEQSIKNASTTFRNAVNKGKEYNTNPYRNAKKKGAKTSTKKDDAKTSGVTFKGDATIQDISKGLRVMFNKFKENDKTLALAGFLIDALDEFDENNK